MTIENALKAARSAGKRTVLLRLKSGDAMRFLTAPAAEAANVGGRISTLTRKDVTAMFGKLDDVVIAKIIATGPTPEELEEAHAWPANDEPMMNAGHPLPSGRVARVVDIVVAINEEEEQEDIARRS